MELNDFLTEQWMNEYEGLAVFNMTDTCVEPLTMRELAAMDQDHFLDEATLDYGVITGDARLKQEILRLYKTGSEANLTTSHGCLLANDLVMHTFLSPGDTVVTFVPGYQQFTDLPESIGCRVIRIPLHEEKGWMPEEEDIIRAFEGSVRMLIVNNPSNPTGAFFDRTWLEKLIGLCRKQNTLFLCDEVFRGKSEEEISVSDLYEYGISTSGLSKMYSLPGLRLGWIKASEELIHELNVRRDYSFISTGPLSDILACTALKHQDELTERNRKIIEANKQVYREWLAEEPNASLVMPAKGTVGFLKYEGKMEDTELAITLLKESGVFFVPGSCFGCPHHLRIGFTRDPEMTRKGLQILRAKLREIQ